MISFSPYLVREINFYITLSQGKKFVTFLCEPCISSLQKSHNPHQVSALFYTPPPPLENTRKLIVFGVFKGIGWEHWLETGKCNPL